MKPGTPLALPAIFSAFMATGLEVQVVLTSNFPSAQEAVNAAKPGDAIRFDGDGRPAIVVSKTIPMFELRGFVRAFTLHKPKWEYRYITGTHMDSSGITPNLGLGDRPANRG